MNEENENQPPLETESAAPEQRHHRPTSPLSAPALLRSRRSRTDNSNESHNDARAVVDPATGGVTTETLDRQPREAGEGATEVCGASPARAGIWRRDHRDFRQRLWFSARSETQFCANAAGHFRHARNCAPLCLTRRNVDLWRNAARQSRPSIDQASHDQRGRSRQISRPAAVRRA